MNEYNARILQFLSVYIKINGVCYKYGDAVGIVQGIKLLINKKVFDPLQLQKQALKDNSVFIPIGFIQECAGR